MKQITIAVVAFLACLLGQSSARAQDAYVVYVPINDSCGCETPAATSVWFAATPPFVYDGPVTVRSRYRPLLGGVVTRTRQVSYGDATHYYAPIWWW